MKKKKINFIETVKEAMQSCDGDLRKFFEVKTYATGGDLIVFGSSFFIWVFMNLKLDKIAEDFDKFSSKEKMDSSIDMVSCFLHQIHETTNIRVMKGEVSNE